MTEEQKITDTKEIVTLKDFVEECDKKIAEGILDIEDLHKNSKPRIGPPQ